jgi:arylsulfatase A-like enzyme
MPRSLAQRETDPPPARVDAARARTAHHGRRRGGHPLRGPSLPSLRIRAAVALGVALLATCADAASPPNILFVAIDDLNHWVGHLGRHPQARTPHIDRLAASGVTFSRAYCAAPACSPSRAAVLSGLRPWTTGAYENPDDWKRGIDQALLLNSHLARAGYRVCGAGKIYHGAADRGGHWDAYFDGAGRTPLRHPSATDDGVGEIRFAPLAGDDEEMPDHGVVDWCLARLAERDERPLFLACGLLKPHLPFSVPKKWFDRFPPESIQLPPWRPDDLDDVPAEGVWMARPDGPHADILASGRWKDAVRAYLATIAFCDHQVGRLLAGLDASGHADDTIVVLWSDHGWSLGEKSHWKKFALWEEPTRSVLIWRVPGVTPAGGVCSRTVDLLSIYPTLCSLAGFAPPPHLEGHDLAPLLRAPDAEWTTPAITTNGRGSHAVRSEGWRYIRYAWGGEELYDERADPLEHVNLASRPEYDAVCRDLARWLPTHEAPKLPARAGLRSRDSSR